MSDDVIETKNLTRYFGSKKVVDSLNLSIPRGCVFGFLGRNGAGKSTTIKMLLGFVEPTRGSATILGYPCTNIPAEARGRIGYLSEEHSVYGWMTVNECRKFQAGSFPTWNEDIFQSVIKYFGLDPKTKAKNLSRGERAGLCLALTLAPEPELLILDDPALGLDPVARRGLLEAMVYVTRGDKRTILFSSHLLDDVERVADQIAILDQGVLRANCTLETFRKQVVQVHLRFKSRPPSLPPIAGLLNTLRTDGELLVTVANYSLEIENQLKSIGADHFETVPLSLEDAWTRYMDVRGEKTFFLNDLGGK